jgi:replicative DNA helicase
MRRIIEAGGKIAHIGYEAGPDIDAALDRAEDILFQLRTGERFRDFIPIREVLDQYLEQAAPPIRPKEGPLPSIYTGFSALDEWLGGLQRSDLVILASRPSIGKTSLALSIARNAAVDNGAKVAIFSLEMSREAVAERLLAAEADVDTRRLRLRFYTEEEERRIMDAAGNLSEAPIYLDDSPQLKVMEIRAKSRRLHYEKGIDLIIVDYIQMVQGDGRAESRVQEISHISRSLKALARELNIPILALSQLSRAPEWRASHRPQLSDLRESGSLEQDADVVLFIYRDEVYYTEEEWERENPTKPYPKGIADIIIAKHRNGPIGEISLRFVPRTAKFANLETRKVDETLPGFSI